jgi:hypothetical protein
MGVDPNATRLLIFAKSFGVDFSKTVTIGRQRLYLTPFELRQLLTACGQGVSKVDAADICNGASGYSENLFHFLGAQTVHSFDYSDYEGSTHTHDMNEPIPEDFKEAYTVVFDGGSLEHIFNFPVAIKNCMEMTKVGGHYLAITPANNCFGHGFYQFSPELYFTALSEQNGFKVQEMIAFEVSAKPVWYVVKSPREVTMRVTLSNSLPVYLLVIAERITRVPIFEHIPHQSDYVHLWDRRRAEPSTYNSSTEPVKRSLPLRIAKLVLPVSVRIWLRRVRGLPVAPNGFDPRFFERMDWPA